MKGIFFSFVTVGFALFGLYNQNAIAKPLITTTINANYFNFHKYLPYIENLGKDNFGVDNFYVKRNHHSISPGRTIRYQRRNIFYQAEENSSINLDSRNLRQANNLVISADAGTQITGQITLDGRVIKIIRGRRTAINLSNCLSKGKNTIEINGKYTPANSSVEVEFLGSGTRVSQATGGSGIIRQTLIIDVY